MNLYVAGAKRIYVGTVGGAIIVTALTTNLVPNKRSNMGIKELQQIISEAQERKISAFVYTLGNGETIVIIEHHGYDVHIWSKRDWQKFLSGTLIKFREAVA